MYPYIFDVGSLLSFSRKLSHGLLNLLRSPCLIESVQDFLIKLDMKSHCCVITGPFLQNLYRQDLCNFSSLELPNQFIGKKTMPQRICYSHWANGAQNGAISIG